MKLKAMYTVISILKGLRADAANPGEEERRGKERRGKERQSKAKEGLF